eukprot:TRINITY_DN13246_c0_g2_i1.p1 TRINITY_DN13246_c0_g2~~TRINITY_DN13246_c0_g2_i1.p1  ORF type:complete len:731 (+),score=126.72 TRINITY_DN13246_c0_g2_i1:177-2195(+)
MRDWLHQRNSSVTNAGEHERPPMQPASTLLESTHRKLPFRGTDSAPFDDSAHAPNSNLKTSFVAPPLPPPTLRSSSDDAISEVQLGQQMDAQPSISSCVSLDRNSLSIAPIQVGALGRQVDAQPSGSTYETSDSNKLSIIPNQIGEHALNKAPKQSRNVSLHQETSEASGSMHVSSSPSDGSKVSTTSSRGSRKPKRRRASLCSVSSEVQVSALREQLNLRRLERSRTLNQEQVAECEDEDASESDDENWPSLRALCYHKLQACVLSWQFEFAAAIFIVADLTVMGLQTNYAASNLNTTAPLELTALQRVIVSFVIFEILLRIVSERTNFFCDKRKLGWNCFDLLIVLGAILETSLELAGEAAGESGNGVLGGLSFRMVRMIRIFRLIRILRITRIIRFVTPLRTLVMCVTSTLKSLVWSLVLLCMIMYGMAIMLTGICTDYRMEDDAAGSAEYVYLAESTFQNLPMGVLTLFSVVAGSKDFSDIALMIFIIDPWFGGIFCLYIAFCVFAVLNVMTGVFCQAAIDSAQRDQDLVAEAMLVHKARHVEKLRTFFESIDTNEDGMLDLLELEECFDNEQTKAMFASLDIHLENAWQLFNLLDCEGNGEVNAMDFVDLCFKVKGTAKTIDIACLTKQNKQNVKKIRREISDLDAAMKDQQKMMREVWTQVVLKSR